MPAYRFAICKGAAGIEELGFMEFSDDAEAMAFGEHIIDDLMTYGNPQHYVGWSVNIAQGERAVCTALFDAFEPKPH